MREQNDTAQNRVKAFINDALSKGTNMTEDEINRKINEIQGAAFNEVSKRFMRRLQQVFTNSKFEAIINKSQYNSSF